MSKPRIAYGSEQRAGFAREGHPCHDCRVEVGQLHVEGCDVEECENCHGQRISCQCCAFCHQVEGDYLICTACSERLSPPAAPEREPNRADVEVQRLADFLLAHSDLWPTLEGSAVDIAILLLNKRAEREPLKGEPTAAGIKAVGALLREASDLSIPESEAAALAVITTYLAAERGPVAQSPTPS